MHNQSRKREWDDPTPEQRQELVDSTEDRLLRVLDILAYPALGLLLIFIFLSVK